MAVGLEVMLWITGLSLYLTRVQRGCLGEGVALLICFPVPPTTLGEEENISVIVNQTVTLECPAPRVPAQGSHWLKDGNLLTPKPGMQLSAEGTVLQVMFWGIAEDGRGNGAENIPHFLLLTLGCRGKGPPSFLPVFSTIHTSHTDPIPVTASDTKSPHGGAAWVQLCCGSS